MKKEDIIAFSVFAVIIIGGLIGLMLRVEQLGE